MNHKLKSAVFKLLEKVPTRMGDNLYHLLQQLNAKSIKDEYNFQRDTTIKFANELGKLNLSFKNKSVIEIGSGWLPAVPYDLIFQYGANEVRTYDINEHYQSAIIKKFNKYYGAIYPKINLPSDILANTVKYFPRTNLIHQSFEESSIDAVISRNVLEHVSAEDLVLLHEQAFRYLRPGSFIIHQISPSDHRAYTDRSISMWDFLQYSREEWDRIQTRFDYHNRLRMPEYINLFKRCGFKILHLGYKSARNGQEIPTSIHADFQKFTTEELTAGSIIVILTPNK